MAGRCPDEIGLGRNRLPRFSQCGALVRGFGGAKDARPRRTGARSFSFSRMASRAAAGLPLSGPPAWAMSGRPPPPLPPIASAATRTRSTALIRPVRSSVTPTTMEALPSAAATKATTPEPTWPLAPSARLLRSLGETPSTSLSTVLRPAMVSLVSPPLWAGPASANCFLASANSRSAACGVLRPVAPRALTTRRSAS